MKPANVTPIRRMHELERHVMPQPSGNTSGSRWVDFLTFWHIRAPLWFDLIDWKGVLIGLLIVLSALAFVVSVAMLAWIHGLLPYIVNALALIGEGAYWVAHT